MRRISTQSKKFVARRRLRTTVVSLAVLAIVLTVVWTASWVVSWGIFRIDEIRVAGTDEVRAERIRAAAAESLEGAYLGIFPKSSGLVYPETGMRRAIAEGFPEIASVSASRKGLKTLEIEVVERDPAAIACAAYPDWQGDHIALTDPGNCHFLDQQGKVFGMSPSFSGGAYPLYYVPELALLEEGEDPAGSVPLGTAVAEGSFAALQGFYRGAAAAGIYADALFVKGDGEYELYARNIAGGGSAEGATVVIHFGGSTSIAEQLSNLVSFWNHMKAQRPTPSFSEITLTYPPNVYYTVNTTDK